MSYKITDKEKPFVAVLLTIAICLCLFSLAFLVSTAETNYHSTHPTKEVHMFDVGSFVTSKLTKQRGQIIQIWEADRFKVRFSLDKNGDVVMYDFELEPDQK